jgi:hypothetical protein
MSYDLKKPKRNSLETEEIRTWARFYRESGDNPALAHEILKQLDLDRLQRQAHLGLYLSCKESLRRHKARQVRNALIGRRVRALFRGVFVALPGSIRAAFGAAGSIAVECLPESDGLPEPSATPARKRNGRERGLSLVERPPTDRPASPD